MAKELYAGPRKDRYKIIIGANTITKKNLLPLLKDHKKLLLISDSGVPKSIIKNIATICKLKSKVLAFTIEKGEKSKSISNFNKIINFLAEKNFDRGDAIIAVGGGVVGDISGYVASSYMRGIQFIQIPTTLLAQVDSSVGGKTAINISAGKNLVGAFYNPKGVIIDITSLKTLTKRELMAGLAEVIKYGLIKNKVLFNLLQQNTQKIMNLNNGVIEKMIYESISTKASIVTKDEKEKGIRAILNFGHTIGHVTVLGEVGSNFGAGMTGGFAYVLDVNRRFFDRCNRSLVNLDRIVSEEMESHRKFLKQIIAKHIKETKSERAKIILEEFDRYEPSFWLVSPSALNIQDLLKATTANAA